MARNNDPKPCAGCNAPITWASNDDRWVAVGADGLRHDCPNKEGLKAALRARHARRRTPPPSAPAYTPPQQPVHAPGAHIPFPRQQHPDEAQPAVKGFNAVVTVGGPFPQTLRYHGIIAIIANAEREDELMLIPNDGSPGFSLSLIERIEVAID
jgi:hypothetical protein